jgi:hypothetical protein
MNTLTLLTISISLFIGAMICRHYAGGSLTPPSHRMSTIEPTYWLTQQQRERRELLRNVGGTCLWLCVIVALCAFVEWLR